MHDSLFEDKSALNETGFSRHAAEAGLDLLRFRREMSAHRHSEKIQRAREGGVRSGVSEAPAFFINSIRHESSFGLATLLAAVQAATGGEPDPVEGVGAGVGSASRTFSGKRKRT
jgi:protein-disulfide isomerase